MTFKLGPASRKKLEGLHPNLVAVIARAFLLPGRWSDRSRLYCFELPALVLGISTRQRVTPEKILTAITKDKNA